MSTQQHASKDSGYSPETCTTNIDISTCSSSTTSQSLDNNSIQETPKTLKQSSNEANSTQSAMKAQSGSNNKPIMQNPITSIPNPFPLQSDEQQLQQQQQQQLHVALNPRLSEDLGLANQKILNSQLSVVAKKDFNTEVRALVDIRKFVSDAFILMDLNKPQVISIVYEILESLAKFRNLSPEIVNEAKSGLFIEPEKPLLASTMQGMYKTRTDGRLAYDNSWLIATCSLASINKRHVAIARLAQPTNFGRQSQEVRVLIIILTPNRDKLTKSAWETGRTFATMLTDLHFRHRLYRAKNEYEFKIEMLSMAESMAAPIDSIKQLCKRHADYLSLQTSYADSQQIAVVTSQPNKSGDLPTGSVCIAASNYKNKSNGASGNNKQTSNDFACKLTDVDSVDLKPDHGFGGDDPGDDHNARLSMKGLDSFGSKLWCLDPKKCNLGSGLVDDYKRRSKFYWSDIKDGVYGHRSLYKTTSTTIFLYVSVLLPCMAFGVVLTNSTNGVMTLRKTMAGQAVGGILYAVFSGQPLIVLMTTAPLCIYVKVIYDISVDLQVDFLAFYASVGLFMGLFLTIMCITNLSNLMKYCTRSTEEIFAIFTAFAFGADGVREAVRSFKSYYYEPSCYLPYRLAADNPNPHLDAEHHANELLSILPTPAALSSVDQPVQTVINNIKPASINDSRNASSGLHEFYLTATGHENLDLNDTLPDLAPHTNIILSTCQREKCILFLFLMFGTLWLANSFSSFNRTPYLSPRKRELIKDYALAISVIIFSFVASYMFASIVIGGFEFGEVNTIEVARLDLLTIMSVLVACPLGFMLSVLFYIDQNICGAMVNNAPYKLKKGDYFHLDLLVVALLNILLSLFGFPWMQGKLPHSHLHAKALADYEERVDEGLVHQTIVNIRETRLTGLFCSILIGLSFFFAVPYPLSFIPLPVLSGVFLYTALAEFKSNSIIERVCLFFTEQAAYPPNHYIRRCPQRKIHLFTFVQLIKLTIVSLVGFYPNPYVKMAYPLVVATFVPMRKIVLPKVIDSKYLNSLDELHNS